MGQFKWVNGAKRFFPNVQWHNWPHTSAALTLQHLDDWKTLALGASAFYDSLNAEQTAARWGAYAQSRQSPYNNCHLQLSLATVTCHSRHSVSRLCVPVLPAYLCKIALVTRKLRRKNRLTMHFCKLFSRNMASNLPELIVLKRADENWKSSVYRVLYQMPLIKNRFHPVHCNQIVLLFVDFRELWPLT